MLIVDRVDAASIHFNEWEILIDAAKYNVHLQTDWQSAFIQHFRRQESAFALEVKEAGSPTLKGALVLDSRPIRGTRFWNLKHIVPLGFGPSDFFDIPSQIGCEKQCADLFIDWLNRHSDEWDVLHFNLIPETSVMWRPLVDAMLRGGWAPKVSKDRKFFYVNTSGKWNAYEEKYFYPKNKDLRKDLRRIEREGRSVRLVEIRSGITPYLPKLFAYYAARRAEKRQADVFDSFVWREFLSDVIQKFETKGRVSLSLLLDQNDEIWAHQLDWLIKGIRYHYFHAINESFRSFSPGKVLLYLILKSSFENPNIQQCNFMRGESSYKENFADQHEAYITIEVHNPRSYRNKLQKIAKRVVNLRDALKGAFR